MYLEPLINDSVSAKEYKSNQKVKCFGIGEEGLDRWAIAITTSPYLGFYYYKMLCPHQADRSCLIPNALDIKPMLTSLFKAMHPQPSHMQQNYPAYYNKPDHAFCGPIPEYVLEALLNKNIYFDRLNYKVLR